MATGDVEDFLLEVGNDPTEDLADFTKAVSGAGYASLTGLGQTTAPGGLTQDGDFTIEDKTGLGFDYNGPGGVTLSVQQPAGYPPGPGGVTIVDSIGGGILIEEQGAGQLSIDGYGTGGISMLTRGAEINVSSGGGNLQVGNSGDLIGFYGATPLAQQAAPTTLAEVITILTNLGLCQ